MANCRLVFSLLVLGVVQCLASIEVPVFIWGNLATNEDVKSNPLQKISTKDFETVTKNVLRENPFTVIFIEETLSVEDFSRKNFEGVSSFPYLQANIGRALYLPSVESPLKELKKLADPERSNHIELTHNGLSAEIKPESGKFLFINLKDADEEESRAELLRRHNDLIQNAFTKLQEKNSEVVAFYTARFPSWIVPEPLSRVRRQVSSSNSSFAYNYHFDNLLLKVANMTLYIDEKLVDVSSLSANSANLNGTELNQTLQFDDVKLDLHFYSYNGYWFFNSVSVSQGNPASFSEDLFVTSDVYALTNFSYRCGQNIVFSTLNETKTANLTFYNIKIQPFIQQINDSSNLTFGEQFDCVGFFTVPIWSGLFVVFILLLITFYGIMMMLDIRTNDRFDDPKGKTITINAGE